MEPAAASQRSLRRIRHISTFSASITIWLLSMSNTSLSLSCGNTLHIQLTWSYDCTIEQVRNEISTANADPYTQASLSYHCHSVGQTHLVTSSEGVSIKLVYKAKLHKSNRLIQCRGTSTLGKPNHQLGLALHYVGIEVTQYGLPNNTWIFVDGSEQYGQVNQAMQLLHFHYLTF
ncbi:hypothetical protein B0F90DRAFT_572227 [Multifurca ochricompacta]|uniref:Uncharacterized protein n=1 Tax=Multifurca ochricompacta TaxID=376703 RepID=A0AAD4QN47_9AGAM|nr:hypothetical protein B0F90DRAFT_572227 [Multifurca ochricompacta]